MIALPVILLTYKRFPLSNLIDMFLCLIGSMVALILHTKLHNNYLPAIGIE
jgi:uncharacterized membrane protein YjdF